MKNLSILLLPLITLFTQCNEPGQDRRSNDSKNIELAPAVKMLDVTYSVVSGKDSIRQFLKDLDSNKKAVLCAINRADVAHLATLDSMLVPNDLSGNVEQYSIFPAKADFLSDVNKIIYFSYAAQQFAAYEYGRLVRSGATNMGRKKDPTPTGLYFTNWKAEKTTSTFNDEWELEWNFNIQNKEGIGFHEYEMPGYPASHSCLRLQEADAKYLYNWADEWILKGTDNIIANGTPVIVFGSYPFGSAKPWLQLVNDPHALNISEQQLKQETSAYEAKIIAEQQKREDKTKQ